MARVSFTANLARHRPVPTVTADGATVREVMDKVFDEDEMLGAYVLDEQGRLRKHVNIFVDGDMIRDRNGLSDAVRPDAEIYVLQALSGG